jgi:hypothetical protein
VLEGAALTLRRLAHGWEVRFDLLEAFDRARCAPGVSLVRGGANSGTGFGGKPRKNSVGGTMVVCVLTTPNKEKWMDSDWLKKRLLSLSKEQLLMFWEKTGSDVYGVGFFCDAVNGVVFLVANTRKYHNESFATSGIPVERESLFRWDIGNWEWPGGLFPSSSSEQLSFDESWAKAIIGVTLTQQCLEEICKAVLIELHDMPGSPLTGVEGMIVLGPEDNDQTILQKVMVWEK